MIEQHPIDRLYATVLSRKGADPESSYTAKLYARGVLQIAKKLGEEGVETALAAVAQDREHVIAESADVLYHLLVLWAALGITPEEAYTALDARTHRSGIEEKKSRG
jgi:phosphoribosyl-ATP pyrophosphohydrolase